MIGDSQAMEAVRAAIAKTAPAAATVLIVGESGTGKELIAWEIHRRSARADKPFIKVNCAAIPEDLIESELFGHEKGAFTGASARQIGKFVQADGGTIFLDEIGDMSPRTQAKVLRVLEGGEVEPVGLAKTIRVDVRVIAATNKDLVAEIRAGRFREDLYFRLNVVPIASPPLRDRREDVPALVAHFSDVFCAENNYRRRKISTDAMIRMQSRPWRGNVRELRNFVERVLIMTDGDTVEENDVITVERSAGDLEAVAAASPVSPPAAGAAPGAPASGGPDPGAFTTLVEYREEAEKIFILRKLREFRWNISRMAKAIDTPRSNLYKKLEQYGITRDQVQE
jgi:two-component system nitrogen regulation response regulator NtrX